MLWLTNWTFLLVTWDYYCLSQFLYDYEAFPGQQRGKGVGINACSSVALHWGTNFSSLGFILF